MTRPDRLSLRQRLLLWLLPPIVLLTGIWIWAAYAIVIHFASLAYDRALEDTVETLAAQVSVGSGNFQIDLPPAARRMVAFDRVDRIYYSIADGRGTLHAGNKLVPPSQGSASIPNRTIFYDSRIDGRAVRVAERALTADSARLTIRVAETLEKRRILAGEVLFYMIGPQFLFLSGIVLFLWAGVGRGVAPLTGIRDAISRRTHDDLSPLDDKGLPAEVHQQVQAINDLMARLDTVLDSQRRFIADAAHQLRTPVTTLRTQVELALRAPDPAEMLAKLDNASRRLVRLTNQLLDLSRAEAGRSTPVAMEPLDVADIVRETVAWFVPEALEREIDITVELAEAMPPFVGNRHMLEQMLANLVDNAIRYNGKGGHVCVVGGMDAGSFTLTVRDDGPGIPEEQRQQVLERFYRPSSSRSGGSGLGLAIAREIALLHGGGLTLNAPQGGTGLEIRVELPRP